MEEESTTANTSMDLETTPRDHFTEILAAAGHLETPLALSSLALSSCTNQSLNSLFNMQETSHIREARGEVYIKS
jgi:hypothetical protein